MAASSWFKSACHQWCILGVNYSTSIQENDSFYYESLIQTVHYISPCLYFHSLVWTMFLLCLRIPIYFMGFFHLPTYAVNNMPFF
jgi:hypothetical protein